MYIYNDKTPPHISIERLKTKVTFYTLQMVKKEIFMYLEIKQFIAKLNDPFKVTVQKQLMPCLKCQK